MNDLAMK